MIPVKLTMRNFMCYRDNVPPLYFDGIHLACLSGDNGNGKSALIDAVTWALWGQARAKSDDDLVHSGQTEMEVEFEFRVGQQLYRIIRKRSKPRRQRSAGQSILELQMSTEDSYKSITGNVISQTQQKIIDILHMDYDTFINSAYLRQGHDDEFTQKPPGKRKEVLANILKLSRYDELEEQAKELAKQQGDEKTKVEGSIKDIISELAQKPAYEAEFEQVQGELSSMETTIAEKESRLKELRQTKEVMEKKEAQLEQIEAHIGNAVKDLERWAEQVTQHHSRLKEYQELINQRSTIEEGYAQFTEARRLSEELDQMFRQSVNLERRKAQLDSKIKEAGQSLKTAHIVTQNKISELEAELQRLPELNNQLHQAQAQLQKLAEPEEILRQKKQTLQELQAQINYLESNKTRLKREIREIEEKLSLLSTQTETQCPLCETELSLEGLKLITSKYTTDGDSKSDSLKSNQAELTIKFSELESLKNEISHLESRLTQEKTTVQGKIIILEKEIVKTKGVDQQLAEERTKLAEIEQHLASKDFATTEQEALKALEDELARLDYNAEHHERVRQQLIESEHYVNSKHRLDEADKLINRERENVSRAEKATRELRNSLETDNQKKQTLTTGLAALPTLINNLAEAEDEHRKLAAQRTEVQQIMWSVKTKLQRCTELEIKKKDRESQLAQATGQENIYKELAQAFGKGGIQAILIDSACPEIETEANKLLGRMTDNRMHLKFETQRETKKGNVIEILDITITDELGIPRNYEMFSGGEAFRINFAIRIALSKLLANRAGAPFRTLIIDEGFGTQDSTGIEKLKEAINSIQDDFDKIFVITHIEELRDAFPTRIDVIKTAEGSTLSVS